MSTTGYVSFLKPTYDRFIIAIAVVLTTVITPLNPPQYIGYGGVKNI
ncbi:MAG: hypothetical protein RMY29_026895 [Nostoc sp. CreGUA01]|nr:hypothetical protein [Nostoc sp. CreGUA01]